MVQAVWNRLRHLWNIRVHEAADMESVHKEAAIEKAVHIVKKLVKDTLLRPMNCP